MSRRLKRSNARAVNEERNYNHYNNKEPKDNVLNIREYRKPQKKLTLLPKNLAQENYIDALENPNIDIVFAIGNAGTGKTYLATLFAIIQLKSGTCDKVIISRPNIAVDDKDIGFLPGNIYQKMAPWTKPVLDVFEEYYSVKEITAMIENNVIEMVPLAYIRGRTFKNAVIILDEAQNTTKNSMLSALTRIGEGSKMIITGDTKQSDRGNTNGLTDFISRFENSEHIALCHFSKKDVERHPVIEEILKMYGEE